MQSSCYQTVRQSASEREREREREREGAYIYVCVYVFVSARVHIFAYQDLLAANKLLLPPTHTHYM